MARRKSEIEREIESRLEEMGYELVEIVWAGNDRRPILRLRIDLPGSAPGHGVTVDDCARASRGLEPWLDEENTLSERYVLEVSSPGVERPLVRPADWSRFAGERIAVKGHSALRGESKKVEGKLLGLVEGSGEEACARLELEDGEEIAIPLEDVAEAHLVFRWK